MKAALILVTAGLWSLPSLAAAETVELPKADAIVTAMVPDYWDARDVGDGIQAVSPGGVGMMCFQMTDERRQMESIIDATIQKLADSNDVIVDTLTQENKSHEELGGRWDVISWKGSSREWGATMIGLIVTDVGHGKKLVITYWVSKKDSERSLKSLGKVFASVRPVR